MQCASVQIGHDFFLIRQIWILKKILLVPDLNFFHYTIKWTRRFGVDKNDDNDGKDDENHDDNINLLLDKFYLPKAQQS